MKTYSKCWKSNWFTEKVNRKELIHSNEYILKPDLSIYVFVYRKPY